MQKRHDILSRTIGYLDEEQEALDKGYLIIICSTVTMVVGTLLQILFFYLYNGPFHPFANILVDETEGKKWQSILSNDCIFLVLSVSFPEDSKPEPGDPSNDNMDADKAPSACDQSTQTGEVVDLSKKSMEDEVTNEERLTNPSQVETDV